MSTFYPPNPCCDSAYNLALARIPSVECCVIQKSTVPAALIRACCRCACEFGSPLPPRLGLGVGSPGISTPSVASFGLGGGVPRIGGG